VEELWGTAGIELWGTAGDCKWMRLLCGFRCISAVQRRTSADFERVLGGFLGISVALWPFQSRLPPEIGENATKIANKTAQNTPEENGF